MEKKARIQFWMEFAVDAISLLIAYTLTVIFLNATTQKVDGMTVRQWLGRCLRFGWFSLLAGGMASIILVPAFTALSSSESMLNNHFPTTVKFYTNFVDMLLAHFAAQEPINISDSQVGLNAYCGVAVLLLTVLYLLDGKINLK